MSDPAPHTTPRKAARQLLRRQGFLDPGLLAVPQAFSLPASGVLDGRFELREELGRGAMGVVFRAYDQERECDVAVKVLLHLAESRASRLEREGKLVQALDHPGIVPVHAIGVTPQGPYLAYALVDGARPLANVLPELDRESRVKIVRDVAAALGHAHARGVVHRDVKASNILIDEAGRARVIDFGCGWSVDLDSLTASGTSVGIPRAMAPEQIAGKKAQRSPRTDVWALGVLLYRCLVDRGPFEASSLAALAAAITMGRPTPLRTLDRTVPKGLAAICDRCLERDPDDRYPDAAALCADLDRWLSGPAKTNTGWWAFALISAVVLGVGTLLATAAVTPAKVPSTFKTDAPADVPPTPAPTPPPPPREDPEPVAPRAWVGYLDFVDARGVVQGWAVDKLAPNEPVRVRLDVMFPSGESRFSVEVLADVERKDVELARGILGDHGFRFRLPESLQDGRRYVLQAVVLNPSGGTAERLSSSPQTFSLAADSPDPPGAVEVLRDAPFAQNLGVRTSAWRLSGSKAGSPLMVGPGTQGPKGARRWITDSWALTLGGQDSHASLAINLGSSSQESPKVFELYLEQWIDPARAPLQIVSLESLEARLYARLEYAAWDPKFRSLRDQARFVVGVEARSSDTKDRLWCLFPIYDMRGAKARKEKLEVKPNSEGGQTAVCWIGSAPVQGVSQSWTRCRQDLLAGLRPVLTRCLEEGVLEGTEARYSLGRVRLGWDADAFFAGTVSVADLSITAVKRSSSAGD